jgi:hypothetical protein
MNTSYDMTESSILISKLIRLTRLGKVEWSQKRSASFPEMVRFQTTINQVPGASPFSPDEDWEALIWSTDKEAGFRIFEKESHPGTTSRRWTAEEGGDPFGNPPMNVPADSASFAPKGPVTQQLEAIRDQYTSGRDLVAISIDHENGPTHGEIYVNLISLVELARRSVDKVEPKIERVKQYLEKLAV